MSVPKGDRSEGKLEVIVKARELAIYTIQITNNPRNFNPQVDSTIIEMLKRSAIQIYQDCRKANKLSLRHGMTSDYNERQMMQELAINQCEELVGLIEIAKSLYHVSSKRIEFWVDMTYQVQTKVKAWKESDTRRFRS